MSIPEKILWYFADPMCSWCWGFSPIISQIIKEYQEQIKITIVVGGLRAGENAPLSKSLREEILHHWQEVHRRSGQEFRFENALADGFIYNTEPACRAVVGMIELNYQATFAFFRDLQSSFYVKSLDISNPNILANLAAPYMDSKKFLQSFHSNEIKQKTLTHFQMARHYGVRGFPTVILQNKEEFNLLTGGYRPYDNLKPELDSWLIS